MEWKSWKPFFILNFKFLPLLPNKIIKILRMRERAHYSINLSRCLRLVSPLTVKPPGCSEFPQNIFLQFSKTDDTHIDWERNKEGHDFAPRCQIFGIALALISAYASGSHTRFLILGAGSWEPKRKTASYQPSFLR